VAENYYQRGFGLKPIVGPELTRDYRSSIVERLKQLGYAARAGDLTIKLAREFGFCYGVDRAVEYAYETRARFPERRLFLPGEIIHNPAVNERLERLGIQRIAEASDPATRYAKITVTDVVIVPAFGVPAAELAYLEATGCVLVDTTCGSVLNVWKSVRRYAREGFTSVLHGKHAHEETRATASQAASYPGGRYLCVRDREEAALIADFIRGYRSGQEIRSRFAAAMSPEFQPDRDLQRIGFANQTTMLKSESEEIQDLLRAALCDRWGEADLAFRFSACDTICSATQDRQDAVMDLLSEGGLDLVLVIGGHNSSNTQALARICDSRLPTYHVRGPDGLVGSTIRHRPAHHHEEVVTDRWLRDGPMAIGLTAGASTPSRVVGDVLYRILALRGLREDALAPLQDATHLASLASPQSDGLVARE
jgi:4-hydroxy-3-methylbut-2-enyl diphosphate reductase